jgi:hypothetical protein
LPMPGSPASNSAPPRPLRACVNTEATCRSSSSRPRSRDMPGCY